MQFDSALLEDLACPPGESLLFPNEWLGESQARILKALHHSAISSDELEQSLSRNASIYPRLILYVFIHASSCSENSGLIDTLKAAQTMWGGYDEITSLVNYSSTNNFLWNLLDQCESRDGHRCNDKVHVAKLLNLDIAGIVARILSILQDCEQKKILLSQKGSNAQRLLDLFQALIDCSGLESRILAPIVRVLVKLSKNSGLYPECLVLSGVEIRVRTAVDGGSFGDVWVGQAGEHAVAVKMMRVFQAQNVENILKVFSKEAVLWRQLFHPNLLPFYGIYRWNDGYPQICLVSPWMPNSNVVGYLQRAESADRRALVIDVACGLRYLHSMSIIHGDLKGANILITSSLRACIADFGLSTILNDPEFPFTASTSTTTLGTLRWLAPELLIHESETLARLSCASDIYAFACVCYEIFVGKPPFYQLRFDAQVIIAVQNRQRPFRPPAVECETSKLDDSMWELIDCCWQTDSTARPTAQDIIDSLSPTTSTYSSGDVSDRDQALICRPPALRANPFHGQSSTSSSLTQPSLTSTTLEKFQITNLRVYLTSTLPLSVIVTLFPDQTVGLANSHAMIHPLQCRLVWANSRESADVVLAPCTSLLNRYVIERLDKLIMRYASRTTRFTLDKLERLPSIFDAISRFNFFLDLRHGDNPVPDQQIKMELYRLVGKQGFREPDLGSGNLFVDENVEERAKYSVLFTAKLKDQPGAKYGISILNYSCHDLYPCLLYFDPVQYAIKPCYLLRSRTKEPPLPARRGPEPGRVTVGYGAGGGLSFEFFVPQGQPCDTSFFKLFVTTTYTNFDWIGQSSPFDLGSWKRGAFIEKPELGIWDAWLATVTVTCN